MLPHLSLIIIVALATGVLVAFAYVVHTYDSRLATYRAALESAQKRIDQQISRINILVRSLPGLQSLMMNPQNADAWPVLVLDEGRALLRADGASYWRYSDRDRNLECEVVRGVETLPVKGRIELDKGELGESARLRMPVLTVNDRSNGAEPANLLAVPLVVSNQLMGVYRFLRHNGEKWTSRDADLIDMFVKQLALALENRHLVINRQTFYLELVQMFADLLDSRDSTAVGQTRMARRLARGVAREMDLPDEFVYYLECAALLHDIGKMAIDDHLLKKPGKLTAQEFEQIKKHPELGHQIISPVSMLAPVAPMVLYHQEWFNGKGYPEGLSGEEIPLGARIVGLLDAWISMTCDRPWRAAMKKEEAMKEIIKNSGTQFDPKVVEAFLATIEKQSTDV